MLTTKTKITQATRRKSDAFTEDDETDSGGPMEPRIQAPPPRRTCQPEVYEQARLQQRWRRMPMETVRERHVNDDDQDDQDGDHGKRFRQAVRHVQRFLGHTPIFLVSVLIFLVFCGAGLAVVLVSAADRESEIRAEAHNAAAEAGGWFRDQLDQAILPLFSMAQFATHLADFRQLPDLIGVAGQNGSLPFQQDRPYHRNVSGVCDRPELVSTFTEIASAVKKNANMDGIFVNIQLAPAGVLCLLHPMNNTEDFPDGKFLDSTGAWGLDLFNDPYMRFIALQSIARDTVGVAGPLQLTQCPTCDPFFIARLPVYDESHNISVNGVDYPRWGFATALIAWTTLVEQSGIYESFSERGLQFRLTRTDTYLNQTTGLYQEVVVELAKTPGYETVLSDERRYRQVYKDLETTNNEWRITVVYDHRPTRQWTIVVVSICVFVSFCISYLVYTVLVQKQIHAVMVGDTLAHQAKVTTERNMTAYFAHELRNPLSALDSALRIMTDEEGLPSSTKELVDGMQLCSSFMSSIMNNLLDVRKIEEGKMIIKSDPISLVRLVDDSEKMMKPSVRPGVALLTKKTIVPGRNWVLGDVHRIQQVITNVLTNAIKYTQEGSVTLAISWQGELVQIECIDTGPGIPKSEQKKLFERFVQRGGAPGTGLGLNIAQQIVTMMKGSIHFISDPTVQAGTTCRILLPLECCGPEGAEEASKAASSNIVQNPIEDEISVLIMDDIKINRSMLQRRIQKSIAPKATIVMARTGEEALKICDEQTFDIIICDQFMEEGGGILVGTDVIFALRRKKINTLIIGCSGNDLDEVFFEAGADLVWGKPMPNNSEIIEQWRDGLVVRSLI